MTSIRKLLSALFLALCFSAYSNAQQIDTSGNLINNGNWSGATYGVDPGGCCASISGAGALYDTSTDTIMFSYGLSTLTQTIGLQQALGGTGVQVHGYNYSFDYRLVPNNGGTASMDYLNVNYWLTTSSGQNVELTSYNLSNATMSGLLDSWMTVSGTRTFNNSYLDPQSVSMNISGYDGGFWAGYYGPEVKNISLSVNYSFDPCASDPLYSSSCPGYLEAYMANLFALLGWSSTPEPETEIATIEYSLPTTTSLSATPEETTTGEVKVDAGGVEISTTGELSVPDGIPEEVKEKKPVDMNLISKIVREATDETATMSIVNQSIQDSMAEDANPDFSMTNETLASISRQTENSIQQSILENIEINNAQNESSQQTFEMQQSNVEPQQSVITVIPNEQSVSYEITNMTQNITQGQTETFEFQNENKVETSELQNQSLPKVTNEDKKETIQTVKKDIQDNDAAGNVGIDSLATSPIGFDNYLNKQLEDMAFYTPKEIYKNQKNVDNNRVLRGLGTDRLHQEMVEQQYNLRR